MKNEPPSDPALDHPGVLRTDVDRLHQAVMIDFDPLVISEDNIRKVAAKLEPLVHPPYRKTILRLGGRASGAAEQKLEHKAEKIEGIRRARATFIGGVMTITFDDATLSEAQVIERVRATGAPVKPFPPPSTTLDLSTPPPASPLAPFSSTRVAPSSPALLPWPSSPLFRFCRPGCSPCDSGPSMSICSWCSPRSGPQSSMRPLRAPCCCSCSPSPMCSRPTPSTARARRSSRS